MSKKVDKNGPGSEREIQETRWNSVGRLFGGAFKVFNDRTVARFAERGHPAIGVTQSAVIRSMNPSGTTISELASRSGITRQGMAQLVRDLERKGYVAVEPHPTDGRAKLVVYTDLGRTFVQDALASIADVEAELESILGAKRFSQLKVLLADLIDDTDEMKAARRSWFQGY